MLTFHRVCFPASSNSFRFAFALPNGSNGNGCEWHKFTGVGLKCTTSTSTPTVIDNDWDLVLVQGPDRRSEPGISRVYLPSSIGHQSSIHLFKSCLALSASPAIIYWALPAVCGHPLKLALGGLGNYQELAFTLRLWQAISFKSCAHANDRVTIFTSMHQI